jgi:membrane protein YdbS with pleckstrin-like domain
MNRPVDEAAAWIYRGVWASVVALFKLPSEPPTLPAVSGSARSIRPAPGFLRYLKFFFWLLFVPGDVLPIIGWLAIYARNETLAFALTAPLVAILILPDVIAYVAIHLRYDTTWYVLTDRSLRIRRGIGIMHETTISFENVQNVEVLQ